MNNFESSEQSMSIFIVDAFTDKPFKGNGAAVCLLPDDQGISSETKQKIASEMNLSETAFISILTDGDTFHTGNRFGLSWYTPKCEVPLCGHATLASAATLFFVYGNKSDVLEFETLSGVLKAKKINETRIEIDLPLYKTTPVNQLPESYGEILKAAVGTLPIQEAVLSESKKLLIRLGDHLNRQDLESITTVDAELLSAAPHIAGIIVTLRGSEANGCTDDKGRIYDFISRYFAPWMGISEDPVTGSAHSVSSLYWSKILGKNQLYARQCSKRGGELHLEVHQERVLISGDAVVVLRGKINF